MRLIQNSKTYSSTSITTSIMVVQSKTNKHSTASFNRVFIFILVCFVNFVNTKAENDGLLFMSCSDNKTTPNSAFQLNLRTLLLDLSSNATANKEFYNTPPTQSMACLCVRVMSLLISAVSVSQT